MAVLHSRPRIRILFSDVVQPTIADTESGLAIFFMHDDHKAGPSTMATCNEFELQPFVDLISHYLPFERPGSVGLCPYG